MSGRGKGGYGLAAYHPTLYPADATRILRNLLEKRKIPVAILDNVLPGERRWAVGVLEGLFEGSPAEKRTAIEAINGWLT